MESEVLEIPTLPQDRRGPSGHPGAIMRLPCGYRYATERTTGGCVSLFCTASTGGRCRREQSRRQRKVRARQDTAVGNAHPPATAPFAWVFRGRGTVPQRMNRRWPAPRHECAAWRDQVRVKRCGKSAPLGRRRSRHGKPRRVQGHAVSCSPGNGAAPVDPTGWRRVDRCSAATEIEADLRSDHTGNRAAREMVATTDTPGQSVLQAPVNRKECRSPRERSAAQNSA